MQQQKHRCEKLLLQCFPPGAADAQLRHLHSHYSRKWCKELDCDVQNHREKEDLEALTRISPLLAMMSLMCFAAFAVMILLIGGTDDVLFFIYECGFLPHSLMRSWVQTRDGLRKYAGLPISHISWPLRSTFQLHSVLKRSTFNSQHVVRPPHARRNCN